MLCNSRSLPCMSMPAALEPIFFRMLRMLPYIKQKVSLALNCGLTVVGVYVPNSGQQLARLAYRVNVAELHFIDCRFCWFGSVTSSCSIALLHLMIYFILPYHANRRSGTRACAATWDRTVVFKGYSAQSSGRSKNILGVQLSAMKLSCMTCHTPEARGRGGVVLCGDLNVAHQELCI